MLPWAPKIFYGLVTDTFPICKSRKRSYIVLMGALQCLAALAIALVPEKSPYYVCAFGTMIYLA